MVDGPLFTTRAKYGRDSAGFAERNSTAEIHVAPSGRFLADAIPDIAAACAARRVGFVLRPFPDHSLPRFCDEVRAAWELASETAEQVPWLVRAGVHQFRIEGQARPGGSAKAYVDAGLVRSWRLLLDSTAEHLGR